MSDARKRCNWAADDLLSTYHDEEWGIRPTDDARWLEFVVLETFQAGLSWRTILHKRNAFRRAFVGFDPVRVASFEALDVERLLQDETIVRHRKKIEAAVENAKIAVALMAQHGSLDAWFHHLSQTTDSPEQLLDALCRQFRFVGRTTAESIAFATGLLPAPHEAVCWRYATS